MGSHQYPSGSSKGGKLIYTLKNKISHIIFKKNAQRQTRSIAIKDTQPAHCHTVLWCPAVWWAYVITNISGYIATPNFRTEFPLHLCYNVCMLSHNPQCHKLNSHIHATLKFYTAGTTSLLLIHKIHLYTFMLKIFSLKDFHTCRLR